MKVGGAYYSEHLAAENLRHCYELAPPPVRRYLRAESEHVATRMAPGSAVLELGCGYGRVLEDLVAGAPRLLAGIDISPASLRMASTFLTEMRSVRLARMNALHLAFASGTFDLVFCIQNGISAFHVDRRRLMREAVRVTAPGGTVLFSSYAAGFWDHRLEWFRMQANAGLIGEIDEESTADGVIRCRDGFSATTVGSREFRELAGGLGCEVIVRTVQNSSLFCEIEVGLPV